MDVDFGLAAAGAHYCTQHALSGDVHAQQTDRENHFKLHGQGGGNLRYEAGGNLDGIQKCVLQRYDS